MCSAGPQPRRPNAARRLDRLGQQRAAAGARDARQALSRGPATGGAPADPAQQELLGRYLRAWEVHDSTGSWPCSKKTRPSPCRRGCNGMGARGHRNLLYDGLEDLRRFAWSRPPQRAACVRGLYPRRRVSRMDRPFDSRAERSGAKAIYKLDLVSGAGRVSRLWATARSPGRGGRRIAVHSTALLRN